MSLTSSVLDRAVAPFSRRLDRRSMLRRSTMAATAAVVAPADFLLRPNSAYAAVCNCVGQSCACGSLCCDAYTEFCCTLTGENGCPPGTVAGGWWKVDGSGFCGGAPRYYLDCNAQCGGCGCSGGICDGSCSGTPCGCANGDCNNRKAGCTKFRYGQCNQHIACLGPIVCRVVTCTAPWVFDGSCTTASRTDNRTAQHHRACLDAPFGAFDNLVDVGGALRVIGWAIDQDRRDQAQVRIYVDQNPVVAADANLPRADVGAAYPSYGDDHGFDVILPVSPGRHTVCVLAYDPGSRATKFLAFATPTVLGPWGSIDQVQPGPGNVTVAGWAVDPRTPTTGCVLRLLVDGAEAARFTTGEQRADVLGVLPGVNPNAGFRATVGMAPGAHQLCLEMLYDSGYSNRIACRDVVV